MQKAKEIFLILFLIALSCSIAAMELFWVLAFLLAAIGKFLAVRKSGFEKIDWKLEFKSEGAVWVLFGYVVLQSLLFVPAGPAMLESIGSMKWILIFYGMKWSFESLTEAKLQKSLWIWLGAYALVSLYAIWQGIYGIDLVRGDRNPLEPFGSLFRAEGFFDLPLTFAYNFGLLFFLILGFYFSRFEIKPNFKSKTLSKQVLAFICLSLLFIAIFVTGVRGAWLASAIALGVFVYFAFRSSFFATLVAGVVVISFGFVLSPTFRDRLVSSFQLTDASNFGRLNIWSGYWHLAIDNPIFGVGLKRTSQLLPAYYEQLGTPGALVSHAHNNFLQFFAGTGIIGFVLYTIVCLLFLQKSWRSYVAYRIKGSKLKFIPLGLFSGQIFFHLGGLTECNFLDSEVQYALVTMWALTAVYLDKSKKVEA